MMGCRHSPPQTGASLRNPLPLLRPPPRSLSHHTSLTPPKPLFHLAGPPLPWHRDCWQRVKVQAYKGSECLLKASQGPTMTSSTALAIPDPLCVQDHQPPRAGTAEGIRPTEDGGRGNILLL
uniref:Uncharacterized protein n=1 Tax=Myotis myotis TaxID=51298 RepID=A0A7J7Y0C8_MYOMY|nr:hypothetical protein mMyoMyo1_011505 [Myotis myotis]